MKKPDRYVELDKPCPGCTMSAGVVEQRINVTVHTRLSALFADGTIHYEPFNQQHDGDDDGFRCAMCGHVLGRTVQDLIDWLEE